MSTETAGTTSIPPQPDFNAIKQRQQQIWSAGDYGLVGSRILLISELLCEAVDLRAGQRVLDVASGNGNAALAAARRSAVVTSTDFVPELLDRGRVRAEAEGLELDFEVADAENLPYPDASFDVVLSVVGAMFAPDHERVASEMLRVCRPGGKIGMANWTPDGFVGTFFRAVAAHVPPPAGVRSPLLWGTEEYLHEIFGSEVSSVEVCCRSFMFRNRMAQDFIDFMRTWFGPLKTAFESLDAEKQESLTRAIRDACQQFNVSGDDTSIIKGDYLEVVAVRA